MKVEGTYHFDVLPKELWDKLLDPAVLSSCIPGAEKFEAVGDESFDVELRIKVAAITGKYTGNIVLADKNYPQSYKMLVQGRGSGGSVKGEALLNFSEVEGGTDLHVVGDAQVTGMIARVGQRLIGSASRMLMGQFFTCLKEKVEAK